MRHFKLILAIATLALFLGSAGTSLAVEKMIGVVDSIEMAADGNSASVILINNADDEEFTVIIKDELTLEKFKDNRIVPDDEVRVKYEAEGDDNVAVYFRKTAGC